MSKVLLPIALALLVLVPSVQAQAPAHTVTISIEDLPAQAESNGTQLVVPFEVRANIAGATPCAAQNSAYTVTLDATVLNSTGNFTSANVNPRQVTIAGPVLLPIAGGAAERVIPATLVVNAGPYAAAALNATVQVTATFSGSAGGCPGVTAAAASSDEATLRAGFEPVRGFGVDLSPQNEMPGPGLPLSLLALAALAIVARRK